jgi:RND family efflux transporter MFP subunit
VTAAPPPPLEVLSAPVRQESSYLEARAFAGRLEPARSAALGFERGGRIADVRAREGDEVAAGQILARLDTAILENTRARLTATRAAQAAVVELARVTDARQAGLTERAVSAQRRDEARLELARAEAELAATDAALDGVAIELAKSELRAPFAGHVAARLRDEGATVAAGEPALELLETGAPRARIGVAPDVAAGLELGARYALELRGAALPARLAALRPDLDPASRTVVALFDLDPGLAPRAGFGFGDVVVFVARAEREQPGYWLPLSALTEGERGLWAVNVVLDAPGGGQVAGREAVRVVTVEGERAYVSGAIPDGAEVVIDGAHRVVPGQPVRQILAGTE